MELEQLRIFAAVAKYKSFSEAARRLYISHSTTSRAVSALEKELDLRLVERDNRVIDLTAAGKVLAEEAARLLELEQEIAERVKSAAKVEEN